MHSHTGKCTKVQRTIYALGNTLEKDQTVELSMEVIDAIAPAIFSICKLAKSLPATATHVNKEGLTMW